MSKKFITIRKYKPTDAKTIAELYYNTIHNINIRDYTEEQVNVWAPYNRVKNYNGWQEKLDKIKPFVAVIDETIVGFAEFEENGHIDCFYVHHKFQGKGIATKLMEAINTEAMEKKIVRIYAEVSITAKPFFEKSGFTTLTKQTVVLCGVGLTNFVMEKINAI